MRSSSSFPFVLFLANPFGPAVLVPILRRLRDVVATRPRDTVIVYAAPNHGDLIERETTLTCVERSVYHNTYRTRSNGRDDGGLSAIGRPPIQTLTARRASPRPRVGEGVGLCGRLLRDSAGSPACPPGW